MSNFPLRYITVHAAATKPSMDIGVNEIRQWHLEKGWNDVGYHYIIRRDGSIEKGRQDHIVGAHVGKNNTGNLGICLVGGVSEHDVNKPEDNFTSEQYTALSKLLARLIKENPNAKLMGHNDFPGYKSRGCPCFNQHVYFEWLIKSINSLYKPDDWFDVSKYNWKENIPSDWKLPNNFYDEIIKIKEKK